MKNTGLVRFLSPAWVVAMVLASAAGAVAEMRSWVRADGRRIEAEYVGSSGDRVLLVLRGGIKLSMSITDLSAVDQSHVRALMAGGTDGGRGAGDEGGGATPTTNYQHPTANSQHRTSNGQLGTRNAEPDGAPWPVTSGTSRPALESRPSDPGPRPSDLGSSPPPPSTLNLPPSTAAAPAADPSASAFNPLPSFRTPSPAKAAAAPAVAQGKGKPSKLWGANGEEWTPASRLPDFSFAGYRCGEKPVPEIPVATDATKHGAKGNGSTDDTDAIQAAIDATPQGAVLLPAGRYVITRELTLRTGGVVLRGEGPGRTVLVCPKSLSEVHGAALVDNTKSKWAFSGGFVTMRGSSHGSRAADVAEPAKRGDTAIVLSDASAFRPGDYIRLTMNNAASLGRYIHGDRFEAGEATFKERKNFMDWVARVVAVEGTRVTLDRPLRLFLRPEWKPEAWTWQPGAEDMGVEDLSFEFPGVPKKAHLLEVGYNAIQMSGVVNGWVRNVEILDCDNGIIASGCRFCLVENVRFDNPRRKDPSGHHAMWATGAAQDCLFTRFQIATRFVHDLTVEGIATGNVSSGGRTEQLTCDHHCNAPYENLFTDLDAGDPSRLYVCGGRGDRGPHTGIHTTFWNIRGKGTFAKPPDWPRINLVAVGDTGGAAKGGSDAWIESLRDVWPPDLHKAQQARRLAAGGR